MILGDTKIAQYVESGLLHIEPFDDKNVGPASIDLTLGHVIKKATKNIASNPMVDNSDNYEEIDLFKKPFYLKPRETIQGYTREYVKLPSTLAGNIHNRSSLARLGLDVAMSSFANPGYEGNLPLVISNFSSHPIQIIAGLRVCQLVLTEVNGVEKPYNVREEAKYVGETGVVTSKIHLDKEINEFLRENGIESVTEDHILLFQKSLFANLQGKTAKILDLFQKEVQL
ncbi:dCTP deaminase [Brevibacillus choshinensis]|uniref:dCTP deaminase n=1 Tax=Brevibacillus choshinensis TaxID=54911 RepID=A0ABX7FL02_BRECH|nr:dCTP deaminase [Brevibacillus choshinensis]QRG66918.1 dCTP deaminase [Brevibacillus choshinensis]